MQQRVTLTTVVVAAIIVTGDQLTKSWAGHRLSGGRTIDFVASVRLSLSFNSGMSFSRARGFGPVIAVLCIVVVLALLRNGQRATSRETVLASALVIGGALGNVADRAFRPGGGFLGGHVIDFIDVPHFAVFNVADMAINAGVALFVLAAWSAQRNSRPTSLSSAADPSDATGCA